MVLGNPAPGTAHGGNNCAAGANCLCAKSSRLWKKCAKWLRTLLKCARHGQRREKPDAIRESAGDLKMTAVRTRFTVSQIEFHGRRGSHPYQTRRTVTEAHAQAAQPDVSSRFPPASADRHLEHHRAAGAADVIGFDICRGSRRRERCKARIAPQPVRAGPVVWPIRAVARC